MDPRICPSCPSLVLSAALLHVLLAVSTASLVFFHGLLHVLPVSTARPLAVMSSDALLVIRDLIGEERVVSSPTVAALRSAPVFRAAFAPKCPRATGRQEYYDDDYNHNAPCASQKRSNTCRRGIATIRRFLFAFILMPGLIHSSRACLTCCVCGPGRPVHIRRGGVQGHRALLVEVDAAPSRRRRALGG